MTLELLTTTEKRELLSLLEEKERRKKRRKFFDIYPETGPLRRELYAKHMEFFAGGSEHMERCMMAANRVGKTWGVGAFETTCHVTGRYPAWWIGRRFDEPVDAWCAGETSETTRDVVQFALTGVGGEGSDGELGTGMLPGDSMLGKPSAKRGISGAMDTIRVRHEPTGGVSLIGFKSFDQGRAKFQGTRKHLAWLDEEPPIEVYEECALRLTATIPGETNGLMLCTFTPLQGLSRVSLKFLPHLAPEDTKPGE